MKIKVFYNKSCNICKTEIDHYKSLINNKISFINIIDNKEAQKATSKSYKDLIRRLHVFKEGKVIVGAKAFLEIWKIIPKYRILYHLFKFKIFYIILFIFYEIAALFLYLKNKHLLKNEKKANFQLKYVQIAKNSLYGERNGEEIGRMLNFVQKML